MLNIEKSILASIIFDPAILEELTVSSHHFQSPYFKNIFDAIIHLSREDKPIDETLIQKTLQKWGKFDESALLDVLSANPLANVNKYEYELIEAKKIKDLESIAFEVRKMKEEHGSSEDIIAFVSQRISDIDAESVSKVETLIDVKIRVSQKTKSPKYETGIRWFDDQMRGGLTEGSFVNIAGESFVGKTTFVLNVLGNIAKHRETLFFSYEMYENTLVSNKVKDWTDEQLRNTTIIQKNSNIDYIESEIRRYSRRGGRFVAVDSKMKVSVKWMKDQIQIDSHISKVLSKLAQETGCIIILINQMSSESVKSNALFLKGSNDQEFDSDVMLFIGKDKATDRRKMVCKKDRINERTWSCDMIDNQGVTETYYDMGAPL